MGRLAIFSIERVTFWFLPFHLSKLYKNCCLTSYNTMQLEQNWNWDINMHMYQWGKLKQLKFITVIIKIVI